MSKITMNAALFAAVGVAASSDETCYYLKGVFVEHDGDYIRNTATDGHMLITGRSSSNGSNPEPFKSLIISIDKQTDPLLKACRLAKAEAVAFDLDAKTWAVLDATGYEIAFGRWAAVDGTYPEYQRVIPAETGTSGGVASFSTRLLTRFNAAAKTLEANAVAFHHGGANDPSLVSFGERQDVIGVLMPMCSGSSALPDAGWAQRVPGAA